MSEEQKKVGEELVESEEKEVKMSFREKLKDFFEFCADDLLYGSGRIFLALIIMCILVITVMLLNKLRAHTTVDIDNRLNYLYEQAEIYNESDMGEYESIIPKDIKDEAARNGITVEEQLESTYNTGLAKYITVLALMTVFAIVLGTTRR